MFRILSVLIILLILSSCAYQYQNSNQYAKPEPVTTELSSQKKKLKVRFIAQHKNNPSLKKTEKIIVNNALFFLTTVVLFSKVAKEYNIDLQLVLGKKKKADLTFKCIKTSHGNALSKGLFLFTLGVLPSHEEDDYEMTFTTKSGYEKTVSETDHKLRSWLSLPFILMVDQKTQNIQENMIRSLLNEALEAKAF